MDGPPASSSFNSNFSKSDLFKNKQGNPKTDGRGSKCKCGSGKKYKKCCEKQDKKDDLEKIPYWMLDNFLYSESICNEGGRW
jgi:hypothetical protein